jgi:hypothetical protein
MHVIANEALILECNPDRSCEHSNAYREYPSRAAADQFGAGGEPQAKRILLVKLASRFVTISCMHEIEPPFRTKTSHGHDTRVHQKP